MQNSEINLIEKLKIKNVSNALSMKISKLNSTLIEKIQIKLNSIQYITNSM